MRILLLEDDPKIAEHLEGGLQREGFDVEVFSHGGEALARALEVAFDVLVLDILVPGLSGLDLLNELRGRGINHPVLFLSAKDSMEDRLVGLGKGGDDYVVKPYSLPEVIARIRALSRRGTSSVPTRVQVEDLVWEPLQRRISRGGQRLDLTPKEYTMVCLLLENRGMVVSRSQIMQAVWGHQEVTERNALDVQISRLRVKVDGPYPNKLIRTLRGLGVILEANDQG
jgi:two-component system copper resistance phosphate regulon response regulator CusR